MPAAGGTIELRVCAAGASWEEEGCVDDGCAAAEYPHPIPKRWFTEIKQFSFGARTFPARVISTLSDFSVPS